jgi:prepilin-type N-terminal cleavage/methylation domain-containing protein/prepilin-type processing-associated H-X9-DG protein
MRLTPRFYRSFRAFSLVELLVTMAIMSVLTAILLPAVQSMRSRIKVMGCMNNLRQIGAAMNMYASENNGRYPMPYNGHTDSGDWRNRADVYLGTRSHRIKTQSTSYVKYETLSREMGSNPIWFCKAAAKIPDDETVWKLHYALNQYATARSSGSDLWDLRVSAVPNSARTILVSESNGDQIYRFGRPIEYTGQVNSSRRVSHYANKGSGTSAYGSNYLFCDGHVEYLKGRQDFRDDTYTGQHKMWKWW